MAEFKIYNENNLESLKRLDDNSLDAVVTDAPYGLGKEPDPLGLIKAWADHGYMEITGKGFMGKEWDAFVPQPAFWKEVYRVLKPGGYVLCFFGTRTYDWGTLAIRLAGFEIRDCIQWIYGSGFPKSLDVSKALDKMGESNKEYALLSKELCEYLKNSRIKKGLSKTQLGEYFKTSPERVNHGGCISNWELGYGLPTMEQWEKLKAILDLNEHSFISLIERAILKRIEAEREVIGHSVITKLAVAPGQGAERPATQLAITKPSTVEAQIWTGYGTALKPAHEPICVARKPLSGTVAENAINNQCGAINLDGCRIGENGARNNDKEADIDIYERGRFPSNVILDEAAAELMDAQSGELTSGKPVGVANKVKRNTYGQFAGGVPVTGYGASGGASRFFYCAKASRADRDYGCAGLEFKKGGQLSNTSGQHITRRDGFEPSLLRNNHPTVKPISLMRYLVRLLKTPFDSCTILDPFMGSGTTGVAAMLEGVNFIGCEMEKESFDISEVRIGFAKAEHEKEKSKPKQTDLFS